MSTPQKNKPKRRAGRPLKEDSVAIKADKAILDYKSGIVDLLPTALLTLNNLLLSQATSDKVREGISKFVIEEVKSFHDEWRSQDEEDETELTSVEKVEEEEDVLPISKEVRAI